MKLPICLPVTKMRLILHYERYTKKNEGISYSHEIDGKIV